MRTDRPPGGGRSAGTGSGDLWFAHQGQGRDRETHGGQAPGQAVQGVHRHDDREDEVQDLGDSDQQCRPAGQDTPAPQGDADQDQAEDVADDEQVRAEPDGGGAPMLSSSLPVRAGLTPIRAAASATLSEPATVDQNRLMNAANVSTSPTVPSRRAPRRAIRPTVMTPGISVSMAMKVSQTTRVSVP